MRGMLVDEQQALALLDQDVRIHRLADDAEGDLLHGKRLLCGRFRRKLRGFRLRLLFRRADLDRALLAQQRQRHGNVFLRLCGHGIWMARRFRRFFRRSVSRGNLHRGGKRGG